MRLRSLPIAVAPLAQWGQWSSIARESGRYEERVMPKKRGWSTTARGRGGATLLGFLLLSFAAPVARAAAPLGACCLSDGTCDDLVSFQCEEAGGDFIGDGTACANVNCRAAVAAPLLSAAGVVAVASSLVGIGVRRTLARRRR